MQNDKQNDKNDRNDKNKNTQTENTGTGQNDKKQEAGFESSRKKH